MFFWFWRRRPAAPGPAPRRCGHWRRTALPEDDQLAPCRPRGLPIGNLTSQFWSNLFRSDLDRFVTRQLGCGACLRYVEDFVLLADNKAALWRMRAADIERLALERLRLHEAQAQAVPTA